jgi:hypothetical protein
MVSRFLSQTSFAPSGKNINISNKIEKAEDREQERLLWTPEEKGDS